MCCTWESLVSTEYSIILQVEHEVAYNTIHVFSLALNKNIKGRSEEIYILEIYIFSCWYCYFVFFLGGVGSIMWYSKQTPGSAKSDRA